MEILPYARMATFCALTPRISRPYFASAGVEARQVVLGSHIASCRPLQIEIARFGIVLWKAVLPVLVSVPFPDGPRDARLNIMNARVDHLLDEVLGLPAEERSALAIALLDSLETADKAGVSELWRAEASRRRTELRAGRVQAAPWTEVRQRLSSL